MSQLERYDITELVTVDTNARGGRVELFPGALVRHKDWPKSLGTALTRCWVEDNKPMQVLVLWSVAPGLFTLPNVRRVHQKLIANQLTSIQPMTAPSGLIFYLDYTYGSGSKSGSV